MGSNLVIVAVPDENDRVWKVSSEKVPHLTLLFLGETDKVSNSQSIVEFVEHAASTSLKRFYLPVDRRGELGDDKADVLFFKKGRYDFKAIRDFRSTLLQDANIKTAYDSIEQFEPWLPHLTLGYPETPAKSMDDNESYNFYDVQFNKIAVWFGDFEGPEFLLKDYWDDISELDIPMDVAMSDIRGGASPDLLEHYGVKGMRWGVRRRSSPEAEATLRTGDSKQDHKDARVDAKWLKVGAPKFTKDGVMTRMYDKQTMKLQDATRKSMKADAKAINKKPEYKTKDAKRQLKEGGPIWDKHDKEHRDLYVKHLQLQAEKHLDPSKKDIVSPSGKWQKELHVGKDGSWIIGIKKTDKVKHDDLEHAEDFELLVHIRPIRDEDGFITDYELLPPAEGEEMAQTADLGAEFLEHFGVKGMRWGVRRAAQKVGRGFKAAGRGLAALGASMADSSWQGSTYSDVKHEAVHNHVAKGLDNHIERLQRSPKYRGKDLKADSDLRKTYYEDVAKVTNSAYKRGVKETYGENYTGTKSAHYVTDARGPRIEVRDKKSGETTSEAPLTSMREIKKKREEQAAAIGHAATSEAPDLVIELKIDDNGQITGVGFVKPSDLPPAIHTANLGQSLVAALLQDDEEALEHYGVKGMRWGQRKAPPAAVAPTATSVVPRGSRRKTKIKTEGGENHDAHDDAIKVARAQAKLKKSGPAALSNQELQEVANRLNLERNVTVLTSVTNTGRLGKGRQFVRNLTGVNRDLNDAVNTGFQTKRLADQMR